MLENKTSIGGEAKSNSLKIIVDFVEGRIDTAYFYKILHEFGDLKTLLDDHQRDWNVIYTYVKHEYDDISSNFSPLDLLLKYEKRSSNPGTALNIQSVLAKFLDLYNIQYLATAKYKELFNLLLDAQPRWLDINEAFLIQLLSEIPKSTKSMQKKLLREKLLSLFRFNSKPPRWVQSPQWPFSNNKPMLFIGQVHIKRSEFFHDDGEAYVFYDPNTHATQTIVQLF